VNHGPTSPLPAATRYYRGLAVVLFHAVAFVVHEFEVLLRSEIVSIGRLANPLQSCAVVLFTRSPGVSNSLICRFAIQRQGFTKILFYKFTARLRSFKL
jgi:hypothetical protein